MDGNASSCSEAAALIALSTGEMLSSELGQACRKWREGNNRSRDVKKEKEWDIVTAVVRCKGMGGAHDSKVSSLGKLSGCKHHSLTFRNRSHCAGGL